MIGKHETTYNGGWSSTMKNPTFRWEQMALISRLIAKPMINISISVWFRSIVKIWSGQKCEVAAEIGLKGYIWRIGWQRQFCEDQVGISEWDAHHFVLDLLNHVLIGIFLLNSFHRLIFAEKYQRVRFHKPRRHTFRNYSPHRSVYLSANATFNVSFSAALQFYIWIHEITAFMDFFIPFCTMICR